MMLMDGAVLPPGMIKDINAYEAECRVLAAMKNSGYIAEYDMDESNRPVALRITIPAGKDRSGYPDNDEHLKITPQIDNYGNATIGVDKELTKPVARSEDSVAFQKKDCKKGFMNRLTERCRLWSYRRMVK